MENTYADKRRAPRFCRKCGLFRAYKYNNFYECLNCKARFDNYNFYPPRRPRLNKINSDDRLAFVIKILPDEQITLEHLFVIAYSFGYKNSRRTFQRDIKKAESKGIILTNILAEPGKGRKTFIQKININI